MNTVRLVCPGTHQVEAILKEHGVVCVTREGESPRALIVENDVLYHNRENILLVDNDVLSNLSSSRIRKDIARDSSVKYLVPDAVLKYIADEGLYKG